MSASGDLYGASDRSAGTAVDTVVIGGGFYGACIATYLAGQRGLAPVLLVEKEKSLLSRASFSNQARVHNGYHYPRSFVTAYRSRINLPRFVSRWPEAVRKDFLKVYAIARRNSKVTSRQFERFCGNIGAQLEAAPPEVERLFSPRLIERVFVVEEYAFDASILARWAADELAASGVRVRLGVAAESVSRNPGGGLRLVLRNVDGTREVIHARRVFNCTYSGLNGLRGEFSGINTRLKHEITEMALMKVPEPLERMGITVMDGPFFSIMPFPARGLHTLSHVRYTPHTHWFDQSDVDPYQRLASYPRESRLDRMLRDVVRYVPAMVTASHVDSLFEIKTVLVMNETDDGRPILMEKCRELPGLYSVLGGKIDNIFDVLERLDAENFADLG